MKNLLNSKKPGVTSLLVVLVLGLILTVMVAGISTLALREQQQATNTDFSNRALQVAESAVKVASNYLTTNATYNKPGCALPNTDPIYSTINALNQQSNQGISCIEIKNIYDDQADGAIDNDRSTEFIMGPDANIDSGAAGGKTPRYISLYWHNDLDPRVSSNFYPNDQSLYPSTEGYSYPASIEMTILWWPRNTLAGTSGYPMAVNSKTIFVMPGRDSSSDSLASSTVQTGCVGQNKSGDDNHTAQTDTDLSPYTCGTSYSIVSGATKKGFDLLPILQTVTPPVVSTDFATTANKYNIAIRIKPRYIGTHFQINAFDTGGGAIQNMKSSRTKIDVTARYGDVYRRIIAEKYVGLSVLDNVFDTVLYAGKGGSGDNKNYNICKKLVIIKDSNLEPDSQKNLCQMYSQ